MRMRRRFILFKTLKTKKRKSSTQSQMKLKIEKRREIITHKYRFSDDLLRIFGREEEKK